MAAEWTNSVPGLLLRLDRGSPVPLRSQLEQALRERIQSGRLAAGDLLPPSRRLAADLGVSRGLVVDCYAQLAAEGYLASHVGSATRVAVDARPLPPAKHTMAPPPGPQIEFRPGLPDLSSFPRRDWVWAQSEACRTVPKADLTYGDPHGSAVLRQVLASYLRRVRGAVADPERMVICAGFAQGLGLILRSLAAEGAGRVAVEEPGPTYREIVASRAGIQAVPVPVDKHGINVDALAATGAAAVVVTPAHQAPTGVVMAPERRHALLAWARRHDTIVIEDDYDSEFRYDREPIGTLQGLAPDRSRCSAASANPWPRACGSAGSSAPRSSPGRSPTESVTTTAAARRWTSWPWPRCSTLAASTATCAGCERSTPPAAKPSSTHCAPTPPAPGSAAWPPASTPSLAYPGTLTKTP